jgi:hypothetical protein
VSVSPFQPRDIIHANMLGSRGMVKLGLSIKYKEDHSELFLTVAVESADILRTEP